MEIVKQEDEDQHTSDLFHRSIEFNAKSLNYNTCTINHNFGNEFRRIE